MRTAARATRTARKSAALAAAALATLSLALTACDGGRGSDSGKASGADKRSAEGSAEGTAEGRAGDSSSGGKAATPSGRPGSAAPSPGDACAPATATITLEDTGGSAPFVLLKITNNGGTACSLFGAPVVRDPTAGENLAVAENTRPRAAVRLAPARSAYAAINLASIDADESHRAKTLGVTLAAEKPKNAKGPKSSEGVKGGAGRGVTVASPGAAGLLLNADSQVTHWRSTPEDAMS